MVNEANGVLSEGSKAQSSSIKNLQTIAGKRRLQVQNTPQSPTIHALH